MRTIVFYLILFLLIVACSCSTPKRDADKILKKITKITIVANQASEDGILDDDEADMINKLSNELSILEEKIKNKYNDDLNKAEIIDKRLREEKNDKIMRDFMKAMYLLYECKGAEKLK